MKKLSLVALLVTLSACKSSQLEGEAIHAKVVLDSAVSASCVLFEVRNPADHSVLDKRWLPRKDELQLAIFKGSLPEQVELAARPYQGGDCSNGQVATIANGGYVTVTASFVANQVAQADALSLTAGKDDDHDTYVDSASGGGDCDDASAAKSPGALESCSDQVDLNCDGKKGCEASSCAANACIGPPAALALTVPSGLSAGTCTSATVQVKDASGSVTRVAAPLPVNLLAAPTGGIAFFLDPQCTTPVTSPTISSNESTTGFYILGQVAGNVTVTASATGLTSASRVVAVGPGAGNRLIFTSTAQTPVAGACSQPVQVQSKDALGQRGARDGAHGRRARGLSQHGLQVLFGLGLRHRGDERQPQRRSELDQLLFQGDQGRRCDDHRHEPQPHGGHPGRDDQARPPRDPQLRGPDDGGGRRLLQCRHHLAAGCLQQPHDGDGEHDRGPERVRQAAGVLHQHLFDHLPVDERGDCLGDGLNDVRLQGHFRRHLHR